MFEKNKKYKFKKGKHRVSGEYFFLLIDDGYPTIGVKENIIIKRFISIPELRKKNINELLNL